MFICGVVRPPLVKTVRSRRRAGGSGLCIFQKRLLNVCALLRRCKQVQSDRQPGEGSDSLRTLKEGEQGFYSESIWPSHTAPRSEAVGVTAAEAMEKPNLGRLAVL